MDENHSQTPLLLTRAAGWCANAIRDHKVPLITSLLVGMLCYAYAFTNKLVNHDEVQCLFSKGATVTSGRWVLGALDTLFPNYSMPLVNGLLALVFLSIAICVIINILSIRSKTLQAVLAGCVIAFPSLIGTFAYMFTVHAFALSFLLAVVSVWFVCRDRLVFWIPALGCMVLSLGIYQSYISMAAGLLVLVLIRQLLSGEAVMTVIRRGFLFVGFLAASLGLYYTATQVILILKDVSMNAYAGGNVSFSLASLPAAVVTAYRSFLRFFAEGYCGLIPTGLSRLIHLLLLFFTGLMLVLAVCAGPKKEAARIALLLALIVLLPLAICCMYLFTTEDSVHTLVLYSFVCVYALAIISADLCMERSFRDKFCNMLNRIGFNAAPLLLCVVIVCNIFLANQVWLNLQLRYENAFAFYTTLLSDLRTLPEFTQDMPVALIGYQQEPEFYETEFPFTGPMTGTKGFKPDSYSRERFITYYLGISLPFLPEEICQALASEPEIQQMPCYPYYGSIRVLDETIIVKLS